VSHNPAARDAWAALIDQIDTCLTLDGQDDGLRVAQSSLTAEQAEALFYGSMLLASLAADVRVIREQQSSKSQLAKKGA
jgi:hypothetical protein